jgi:L-2,4-diaminobutyrate decarboxylase
MAVAADLAASALNPSMDSWDQAPAASELENLVTRTLAAEIYPQHPHPDALVTTGGTESNQLALLLARERHPGIQILCGANAHHSLHRAAWLLGLPQPISIPAAPTGTIDLTALDDALTRLSPPLLVTATAGTTDTGSIDPLPAIADLCDSHGAELHIDAAYGGLLLFSPTRRTALTGLDRAQSVTLDLHKLGWQPAAAGLLAVPDTTHLTPLGHTADYLNADDDTQAGLPDLLGRSLRTTRRPDILKTAVTLKALGRTGLAALIDRTCDAAQQLADLITGHPHLELHQQPTLTTVLFRPTGATDDTVATLRRTLLTQGTAVLGRAHADHRLWLKATLLNPHATQDDLEALLKLVEGSTRR